MNYGSFVGEKIIRLTAVSITVIKRRILHSLGSKPIIIF